MYPGVELRLYRYAVVLSQELNFTRAALRLHVAQPNLSRQIRELEQYIGTRLFERDNHVVCLTAAGEAFAAEARLTLFHAERALEQARAVKCQHKGSWSMGYSPFIDLRILAEVRSHLSKAHPAAEVHLVSAYSSEQAERLMRGQLQAGIVILPIREEGLTSESLYRQPLVLALPKGHQLAEKNVVEIRDLDQLPLVSIRGDMEPRFGESLNHVFEMARVRPRFSQEASGYAEAFELALAIGVPALTIPHAQYVVPEGIVMRHFADDFLTAEIGFAYLAGKRPPILESLRSFLLHIFHPFSDHPAALPEADNQLKLFGK